MGAPSSAFMAEIFLQHLEHNSIFSILKKKKITGYFRYFNDILILYNDKHTNINLTLQEFNQIQKKNKKKLQFTMERGQKGKINFLDITIERKGKN
jgi:hypothetical protein